ncbi:MAG: MaoC family dehydratase [Acidobacteriota bacterium]
MSTVTPEFKRQLEIAFATLQTGQTFTFRRTFTDGEVAIFCGITGDYNPYHIDDTFVSGSWYGRRIIPGLLTASMITHIGGLLGFLAADMHFHYIAPVYIGDTVTCTVTIVEKDEAKRLVQATGLCVNQHDKEVLKASFSGFPACVRLAQ